MSRVEKAAVVGSGFGGLAVAIRLQAAGFQTTIYEADEQPGGRARVFREGDFFFDAGPTVITAPECLEELFELCGKRMEDYVELLRVKPMYRLLWSDGDRLDYSDDLEEMLEQIRARNPEDADGYQRFLSYSKEVFDEGYTKLAAAPFLRFTDMVRVVPQLARLRADRPVYNTVSRFVKDEHLRQALSFHTLLVGGNPFDTSSIYTLIHYLERKWGVYFPRGGTGALVKALIDVFEEMGGRLELGTPVDKIDVLSGGAGVQHRVHSRLGEDDFDFVVSNADIHHTYDKLYAGHPSAPKTTRKLESSKWSMSLFVLYFGTNKLYRDQVAHHTVLFGPRYRALLDEIFAGNELPEDFSLYLHAPTVTDPSMAPEGCDSFYVLSPVPHLGNAPLDWEKIAPGYADAILASLEEHMPGLREHVVVKRWLTPESFRDELNAYQGSAFSCAPRLTQSAWFRPHNRDDHIPGLYIVGAGTHPGAGVPGVVNGAKATARVILEDFAAGESAA